MDKDGESKSHHGMTLGQPTEMLVALLDVLCACCLAVGTQSCKLCVEGEECGLFEQLDNHGLHRRQVVLCHLVICWQGRCI